MKVTTDPRAAGPAQPGEVYDPFARGRFPAGVRTVQARDAGRGRVFSCEIWYPATARHAGQDVAPETQDSFTAPPEDVARRQQAVRDADAEPGTYPLIIYSHHSGGNRRAATYLCTHLSSHGYLVAAVDHSETFAPELARTGNETAGQTAVRAEAWVANRVPDVRFLIDHMLAGRDGDARPDPARIGIVGHSFGGWTALATPEVDERIAAVVALAPAGASNPRPGILRATLTFEWRRETPVLYLVAENDVALPLSGMAELYERTRTAKRMLILRRADHVHFIDNVEQQHEAFRTMEGPPEFAEMQREMRPIAELCSGDQAHLFVRGLVLSHLDAVLRQPDQARRFLDGDLEAELGKRGVEASVYRP